MYYRVCPYCHANLDPGETCDCQNKVQTSAQKLTEKIQYFDWISNLQVEKNGQLKLAV